MLPIRDHNPSGRTPYVTYTLMAANILLFIAYWPLFDDPARLNALYIEWGMIPARISAGEGYLTMVTCTFLHGGFMHLAGNMLFLWIFGDNMEDEMGHVGFTVFYFACGILASAAQWIADPYSTIPTVGASGAIAGIMGGYLLLFPKAKVDILLILIVFFRIFPIPAWVMLGLWFILQLGNGVITDPDLGGVAYWAHAGGFIVGLVLTIPIWIRLGGPSYWSKTHGHPPHPEAQYPITKTSIPSVRRKR